MVLCEGRAFERRGEPRGDGLQSADGVRHQKGSRCRAGNDQQFGGLKKDGHVALLHQEAANDGGKDQKDAYDGEHVESSIAGVASLLTGAEVARLPPSRLLDIMACACAFEQLRQRFGVTADSLCRADAHRERDAIAPPAEVRGPRQPGQGSRMRREHLRAALVGHTRNSSSPQRLISSAGRRPRARACRTLSSIVRWAPAPCVLRSSSA